MYVILGTLLFHKFVDDMLLCCGDEETTQSMFNFLHDMATWFFHISNHFVAKTTSI
jgi:hypothetical protein